MKERNKKNEMAIRANKKKQIIPNGLIIDGDLPLIVKP